MTGIFKSRSRVALLFAGLAGAVLLTSCGGGSIRSVSDLAGGNASTALPALNGLSILSTSPTRQASLVLSWDVSLNGATEYCLLENNSDSTSCSWSALPLPTSYPHSAADGPLVLTAYLRSAAGTSAPISSSAITIDRTAPALASAAIGNSNPTSSTTFSLSYGPVTQGSYADYCILENSTNEAGCVWSTGTLPASFAVAAVDEPKTLSVWVRDEAGNVSGRVDTASVQLDQSPPALASVTILNTDPTRLTLLDLSYGVVTGAYTEYCILTNNTALANCAFTAGTLPPTHTIAAGDGAKALTVWLRDGAGNTSTAVTSNTVTLDQTAPVLASATVSNASPTSSTTFNLVYGSITGPYSQYCILENNTTLSACSFVTGALPATFVVSSTENTKTLSIWLRDAAGNVSARVDANAVDYDGTAPTLASVTVTNANPTNTTTYSLSYGAISGTYNRYCILENDTNVSNCAFTTASLPASFVVSTAQAAKTLSVWIRDAAGNTSARVDSNAVTLDTVAPGLASATITDSSPTNDPNFSLTYGAITDTYASYCIKENDTSVTGCSYVTGTLPATYTVINSNGAKVLSIWLKDSAGNVSTRRDTNSVTLNTSSVTLASVTVTNNNPTNSTTYNLSYGSASSYDDYCILENNTSVGSCSWVNGALPATYTVTPTEGAKILSVWIRNSAMTVSSRVASNSVTLDTTAPSLASLAVTNSSPTNTRTYGLSYGAITDTYASYCILENDTTVGNCSYTAGTLPSSYTVSATENAKVLSIWLKDAAGNVSVRRDSAAVTLDTTVPALASASITNASPTNSTTYALTYGAVTNGPYSHYCILENNTVVSSCTFTAGTLPASFTVSATDGAKVLSVWIRDSAGNVSTRVDTGSVTLDATAPVLASATITNSSPTGSTTYNLSYGTVTGSYADYCILENDTTVGNCSWVTATLPSTRVVSGTQNSKALTIWLRDSVGNVSAPVTTNSVYLDTAAPGAATLSMSNPSNGTTSAYSQIPISGTFGTDAGATATSTQITLRFYLNDNTCASGNLVATTSGAPGAAVSVTTSSLTAGGDGTKTLYYTAQDTVGNTRACGLAGLSYTYQSVPKVSFTSMGYTLREAGTQVGSAVAVQRDVCGTSTTVTVTTSNVTAMSGTNFTSGSTNVVFAASDCSPKTIPVSTFTIASDGVTTGDLFFKAMITGITGGTAGTGPQIAQVNVLDEGIAGEYSFNQPLYTAAAGQTSVTLTVQRSTTSGAASVQVAFVDGSAVAATDYVATTQTVSFLNGEDEKSISVTIYPSTYNASFIAKLVNPSAGTRVRNLSVAKVRILNDATACNASGSPYGGGSGTLGSPYLICSLTQLKAISSSLSSNYRLMADITADATLAPLGTLAGAFDGNERAIFNFAWSGNVNVVGLFNRVYGAHLKGVNLLNASVNNTNTSTGALVGVLGNAATAAAPDTQNILVTGYVSSSMSSAALIAGQALTAYTAVASSSITISKTVTYGLLRRNGGGNDFGGVAGTLYADTDPTSITVTVSDLYNGASVLGTGGQAMGGVFGEYIPRGTASFTASENRGYITGLEHVGGLCGECEDAASPTTITMTNLTNYGTIYAPSGDAGGIGGYVYNIPAVVASNLANHGAISGEDESVGGLMGYWSITAPASASVSNSVNTGSVTGTNDYVGGIVAYLNYSSSGQGISTSFTNNSNSGALSGQSTVGGIIGYYDLSMTSTAPTNMTAAVSNNTNTGSITTTGTQGRGGGIIGDVITNASCNPEVTLSGNTSTTGTVTCTAGERCGGLYGNMTFAGDKTSTISSSSTSMAVSGATSHVGGAIGRIEMQTSAVVNVSGIAASGSVTITGSGGTGRAGGLIGELSMSGGTIVVTNSSASGSVTSAQNYAGGLIGQAHLNSSVPSMTLTRNFATGNVSAPAYVGGLIGQTHIGTAGVNSITVSDSYSSGTVTGSTGAVGGLVGMLYSPSAGYCTVNLSRLYTTSAISTTSGSISGVYGSLGSCTANVTASYWLRDTGYNSGITTNSYARDAYDLSHLTGQTNATFTGWTFGGAGPWNAFVPGNYPTLQ